jgi:hypothetical protein
VLDIEKVSSMPMLSSISLKYITCVGLQGLKGITGVGEGMKGLRNKEADNHHGTGVEGIRILAQRATAPGKGFFFYVITTHVLLLTVDS